MIFKFGAAAVIPVAHRASGPVGSAIPVILWRAADLSPDLVAMAPLAWFGPVAELSLLEPEFSPTHPTRDRIVVETAAKTTGTRPAPARQ